MGKHMATADLIDYAFPTMMAEKALAALHKHALAKEWEDAQQAALDAIKWTAEAHAALMVMEDRE